MNTQIGKWGNSLAVRIPGAFAKELELAEGDDVEVTCVAGRLVMQPRKPAFELDELLKQIKPENLHGETDWGPARGRESW